MIAASTLTGASFGQLLQVCAVLFFVAAVISAVTITNPTVPAKSVPAKSVPCEIAALCRDRHDAQPHLAGHASHHGALFAAGDHGS